MWEKGFRDEGTKICQSTRLSFSYTPEAGHPNYEAMLSELRKIFDTYQVNGNATFEYDTIVYYGRMK
ncbi:MAG: hypothetical protein IGR93_20680 [Hydrococcus sp. C42_A2020_068]|uniref:hypothetical protein n=1 Tax=Pleurocapsa sp. PCC 7327 TaxID=118163 RepID=UPI00030621C2|nr:hypothetical protein [Pleurocapsa sp. PCC 7327]MBF2022439.1 hypothetical protein [Hydrococcus sp. C42_A2020_068]